MDFMEGLLTRRSVRKYDTSKKFPKKLFVKSLKPRSIRRPLITSSHGNFW